MRSLSVNVRSDERTVDLLTMSLICLSDLHVILINTLCSAFVICSWTDQLLVQPKVFTPFAGQFSVQLNTLSFCNRKVQN